MDRGEYVNRVDIVNGNKSKDTNRIKAKMCNRGELPKGMNQIQTR